MKMKNLPKIQSTGLLPDYFPTPMQAFIFRNWGMVDKERLAEVLETSTKNVEVEAARMGLGKQADVSDWLVKGYITIIRSNWHLLPYEQLLQLLGWNEDRLYITLKEDDFLDVKLGNFKPECPRITYRELTDEEKLQTEKIRIQVENTKSGITNVRAPFDFWSTKATPQFKAEPAPNQIVLEKGWAIDDKTNDSYVKAMAARFVEHIKDMWDIDLNHGSQMGVITLSIVHDKAEEYHEIVITENKIEINAGGSSGILRGLYRLEDLSLANGGAFFDKATYVREPRFDARYIYSFSALYANALDVDSKIWCPDELLERYAKTGVNGIWLQGILYLLTEFPFDRKISEGWELRQKNLRDFVNRAKSYGIKIYLYLNEPRSMPHSFFEKYPHLKGSSREHYACMCLMQKETQEYLSGAVEKLCRAIPDLGGFFTITMSENPTHCRSVTFDEMCPHCSNIPESTLVATANRLIAEGAARVSDSIRVIAWNWGWELASDLSSQEDSRNKCIDEMPQNIAILCQRDIEIPFERGGICDKVYDYSMSVDGISPTSLKTWQYAKHHGHETAVKLQINTSWECSTTPYLPVYDTLIRQTNSLIETDINHLMLSWTLGGYPSPNIKLVSESFFIENGKKEPDYSFAFKVLYGKKAEKIKAATDIFCRAFSEFPFNIEVLYNGPQNGGVANPLYHKPTGYSSTMTCYTYDDLKKWRHKYPEDVFEAQFKKVCELWEKGLELLGEGDDEINDIAYISYSLFRASFNQIRFVRLRDRYATEKNDAVKSEILEIVKSEKQLAVKVYEIMRRHPEVGFEAANHYYYTADAVLEKIINCTYLEEYYG